MPTTLPALAPFAPPPGPLREGGRVLRRPAPRRRWIVWLLALLVSLPACLPLLQPGFFASDDGLFHLYRVAALGDAIGQGLLYPRWFAEFGFGYGQPVLHFYSPLSYYLAVPFLPFGVLTATKIVFALGFILPALAMFAFARRWWGDAGGLLAAAVYTYSPYHLADGLLRGALAEHLAFVWPPLIFLTLLPGAAAGRTPRGDAWRWAAHALAWAGLILTHHLTALMLAPIWAGAVICLGGTSAPARRILSAATAFSGALGLTAFYWLPVIAEAGAVKLGADPISTGYRQHLLPLLVGRSLTYVYRLAADQPWQHVLGLCMALLLLLTVAAASGRALLRLLRAGRMNSGRDSRRMNSGRRGVPPQGRPAPTDFASTQVDARWNAHQARFQSLDGAGAASPELSFSPRVAIFIFAAIACLLSLVMLTAPSLPLWQLAEPLLARLQYPWRWLCMTAFTSGLVGGALPWLSGGRLRWQAALALPIVILLLWTGLADLPYRVLPRSPAEVTPEQMWAEDAANGQVGATWTGEFLPVTVTEQRWALGRPPAQPQAGPAPAAIPDIVLLARGPLTYRLLLDSPQAQTIRLHAFYFPGWQVRVDGQRVLTGASGDLGLVTAQIPAGRHTVEMAFEATLPRQVAGVLTALTWWGGLVWLLLAGGLSLADRRGLLIVAALTLAPLLALVHFTAAWQPQRLASNVGEQANLIGADLPGQARPGERVAVTLYWFNLRDTDQNYQVFVHLLDASGAVRAQQDGAPVGGFSPTTRWRPNELILDPHLITLPADLAPGVYELRAGMYQLEPLRNLPVTPPVPDQRIPLGSITVN